MTKQKVWIITGPFNGRATSDEGRIFDVLRKAGGTGMTKDSIMQALGFGPDRADSVSSMLSGLKRKNAISFLGAAPKANKPVAAADIPALEAQFLGLFESLLAARAKNGDLPLEANETYAAYAKMKEPWLGRRQSTDEGTKNECRVAFRLAAIAAMKTIY